MSYLICIGCGCDAQSPCLDTDTGHACTWVRIDTDAELGLCSCCTHLLARWDAGDREVTDEAMEACAKRYIDDGDEGPGILLPGDEEYESTLQELRSR